MANIIARRRKDGKYYVIEKFGDGYGVGRYRYGGLSAGWKSFKYLKDARRYLDKLVAKS